MSERHLPVRPDLAQLKHQAKDLLRAIRGGDPTAAAEFLRHHPSPPAADSAKLADAQLALARAYGVPSWPRLVVACQMVDAIWRDDADLVAALARRQPALVHEMALGNAFSNWGPPLSYAANLGRDRIIEVLRQAGARDLESALDRAILQGRIETAARLHDLLGAPPFGPGAVMGPAETQNGAGMRFLLERGAPIADGEGDPMAPVALLLQTYCRNPAGKRECLERFAARGVPLPDTPVMALHRGRVDLLEHHLRRDPDLLRRTFGHEEVFPPGLGCSADWSLALCGTPLDGTSLLHIAIDMAELEVAGWLLARGADPNVRAEVDGEGFGGHSPLFGCVITPSGHPGTVAFARLLLDAGADPNARASLRKGIRFRPDESVHEYRDVTPVGWGRRFHDDLFVDGESLALIAQRGGRE